MCERERERTQYLFVAHVKRPPGKLMRDPARRVVAARSLPAHPLPSMRQNPRLLEGRQRAEHSAPCVIRGRGQPSRTPGSQMPARHQPCEQGFLGRALSVSHCVTTSPPAHPGPCVWPRGHSLGLHHWQHAPSPRAPYSSPATQSLPLACSSADDVAVWRWCKTLWRARHTSGE